VHRGFVLSKSTDINAQVSAHLPRGNRILIHVLCTTALQIVESSEPDRQQMPSFICSNRHSIQHVDTTIFELTRPIIVFV